MHDVFSRLFERHFGVAPVSTAPLAADGSQRRMVRVIGPGGETAVGVIGPDADENRAFLSFTASFRSIGLPVPAIYGVDDATGAFAGAALFTGSGAFSGACGTNGVRSEGSR